MRGNITTTTRALAEEIAVQRIRAHEKHGTNSIEAVRPRDYARWLPILGEEFGEVCQALTYDKDPSDLRRELVDLVTVGTAWIASLDRAEGPATMTVAELEVFLFTKPNALVWLVLPNWLPPHDSVFGDLVERFRRAEVIRTAGRERMLFENGSEIRVTSERVMADATRGYPADLVLVVAMDQSIDVFREAFKPSMAARPGSRIVYLLAPADPGPRPRRTNR